MRVAIGRLAARRDLVTLDGETGRPARRELASDDDPEAVVLDVEDRAAILASRDGPARISAGRGHASLLRRPLARGDRTFTVIRSGPSSPDSPVASQASATSSHRGRRREPRLTIGPCLTATEFTDRVMAAVALAPTPTPTRTFLAAMRARAIRDAVATLWVAWHLGTVRSWRVAPSVRARSFALVFAVSSVLGSAGRGRRRPSTRWSPHRDDEVRSSRTGRASTRGLPATARPPPIPPTRPTSPTEPGDVGRSLARSITSAAARSTTHRTVPTTASTPPRATVRTRPTTETAISATGTRRMTATARDSTRPTTAGRGRRTSRDRRPWRLGRWGRARRDATRNDGSGGGELRRSDDDSFGR